MSEKDKRVALATLNIGGGNRFSMESAKIALQKESIQTFPLVISNPLTIAASWRQSQVTFHEKAREKYNQTYEKTRNGLPAKIMGLISLFQLAAFLQESKANKLVLTQELPLVALNQFALPMINAIFDRLDEILVLATDVSPKPGAVSVVKNQQKQRNIKIITWNNQSYQNLCTQNINAALVAPWLRPPTEDFPKKKTLAPMAIIRPSGTGMDENYPGAIAKFVGTQNQNSLGYQVFENRNLIQHNKNGKKTATHKNHFSSLNDLHAKMAAAFPEMILSYPSEMIQFMAQLYLSGYSGQHFSFEERGLHEVNNLRFAAELGLSRGLKLKDGQLILKEEDSKKKPDLEKLKAELGQAYIASLV